MRSFICPLLGHIVLSNLLYVKFLLVFQIYIQNLHHYKVLLLCFYNVITSYVYMFFSPNRFLALDCRDYLFLNLWIPWI